MTVHTKKENDSQVSTGEQVILVSLTLVAAIAITLLGATDKWLKAIFCTIPTFAGMISYSRKRMSPRIFWITMTAAFLFHLVLLWIIFGVLMRNRDDISLLVCVPGIFLEGFILYHLVNFLETKLGPPRSEHH
jgi:ABC-type Na+ efflux pump permease subunit